MLGPRARRRLLVGLAAVVAALAALRVAAPVLVRHYVNGVLADMGEYQGHVEDVDLDLWRGACSVRGLTIAKTRSRIDEPFLDAPSATASIQWGALLKGELVGEVTVVGPTVNFVKRKGESQYGEGADWRAKVDALLPVRLNHVEVSRGTLHFRSPDGDPPVDVYLSDVHLTLANLTNIRESDVPVFTGLTFTARAMHDAPLSMRARLDPLQQPPEFDLDVSLRNLDLKRLNPFLLSYLNVTAENGTLSLDSEVAAARGNYEGYVKPLLDHLELLRPKDFKQRPLGAIWETLVAGIAALFENHRQHRIGTRIPISGRFEPRPHIWIAVGGVLRNMFDAFLEGVEGSVDLHDAIEDAQKDAAVRLRERSKPAQRGTGR